MSGSRRLSAIMFTDMVGFTARTQSDESGTLALLSEQEGIVRPLVDRFHGRAVKSTGDGLLAEFPSALAATECAIAVQERLRERNRGAPGRPIELRIGIHLGDVEERQNDIFGDAVNIAARVQPVAEPGGIALSQQVYDQVRNKLHCPLERLEAKSLKGVAVPMDVYRVVLTGPPPGTGARAPADGVGRLAVLPFSNISPDPQDAYISDGLTEEMIATLSELAGLRVIARTSVEPYKTAPKPVAQVGADLGVRWVLEGSVRKARSHLRITVQLIEVASQEHLWSANYDRELDDVFAVQSEIARKVADALQVKLVAREEARLDRRRTPRPDSYLEYLQGRAGLRGVAEAELETARVHFARALELDPTNAAAHAGLAHVHSILGSVYHHVPRAEWKALARHHAERAIALDPELAEAHVALALHVLGDEHVVASEEALRKAIALNPSLADAHLWYGMLLADLGRPDEALAELAIAEELDPLSSLVLGEEVHLLASLRRLAGARAKLAKLGAVEHRGILYEDRRGALALASDDTATYRDCLAHFAELLPGRPEILLGQAYLHAKDGDPAGARALLAAAEKAPAGERPDAAIARLHHFLGDTDAAFKWLDRAVRSGRFSPRLWRYDPDLESLRADPRFSGLLARALPP